MMPKYVNHKNRIKMMIEARLIPDIGFDYKIQANIKSVGDSDYIGDRVRPVLMDKSIIPHSEMREFIELVETEVYFNIRDYRI